MAKDKNRGFPEEVFLTIMDDEDAKPENLLAWREQGSGVDGDGPTFVAHYELVEVVKLSKELVINS